MDAKHPSGPSTDSIDTALLSRALVALELADELISVIRLVDWWTQRASPPIDALLAKARALIVIGQVDRSCSSSVNSQRFILVVWMSSC